MYSSLLSPSEARKSTEVWDFSFLGITILKGRSEVKRSILTYVIGRCRVDRAVVLFRLLSDSSLEHLLSTTSSSKWTSGCPDQQGDYSRLQMSDDLDWILAFNLSALCRRALKHPVHLLLASGHYVCCLLHSLTTLYIHLKPHSISISENTAESHHFLLSTKREKGQFSWPNSTNILMLMCRVQNVMGVWLGKEQVATSRGEKWRPRTFSTWANVHS